jgi:hypothetical protein
MLRPVCRECGHCPRNETWHGFAMPIGVDMLLDVPCAPEPALGRDGAWLPVTHTRAGTALGMWYYYAAGCSDLGLNVGRTLLAPNRVGAALMLESLLLANTTVDARAAARLARRVQQHPRHSHKWERLVVSRAAPALRAVGANATLEAALREAGRGLYEPTRCNPSIGAPNATRCRGACLARPSSLLPLVASATLDPILWRQLQELGAAGRPLDSLVLHQQPQGGGAIRWTTEIWDVRYARGAALPARWLNGSACAHAAGWKTCNACAGSALERRCATRDWQPWCDTAYGRARSRRRGSALCGVRGGAVHPPAQPVQAAVT